MGSRVNNIYIIIVVKTLKIDFTKNSNNNFG